MASNGETSPTWKERIMLTDLHHLSQNGLKLQAISVPRIILCTVTNLAKQTFNMPVNYCWFNPTFCIDSNIVS